MDWWYPNVYLTQPLNFGNMNVDETDDRKLHGILLTTPIEGMHLREASGIRVLDWVRMGLWRKNQFGLHLALRARLSDFKGFCLLERVD